MSRPLASLGDWNGQPDVVVYAGTTYVTWYRDGRIVVASNESGAFRSRMFARAGASPKVGVSGGRLFLTWTATSSSGGTPSVYYVERILGVWGSGYYLAGTPSYAVAALGQAGLARAVYLTGDDLELRAQA